MMDKMLTADSCLIFHRWKEILYTGHTTYSECKDCKSRSLSQREGVYQPCDWKWLEGKKSNSDLLARL